MLHFFFFFFTLVTGPTRSLSLKLSDEESMSLKYEPTVVFLRWLRVGRHRRRPKVVVVPKVVAVPKVDVARWVTLGL